MKKTIFILMFLPLTALTQTLTQTDSVKDTIDPEYIEVSIEEDTVNVIDNNQIDVSDTPDKVFIKPKD